MSEHEHGVPPRARPPWWPATESWPPADWQRGRRRFMRRAALAFGVLIVLAAAACTLSFWIGMLVFHWQPPAGVAMPIAPWQPFWMRGGGFPTMAPFAGLFLFGAIAWLIRRVFRRFFTPLGNVMQAAQRVEQGDYSVRVATRGGRDVRALARSFNAMTARLENNEAQRRGLMADITHELRTPLTIVQGTLEGMADGVYPRDDAHLQTALEETRVLSRLIEDLRMLSLAESGALKLQRERASLRDLISEVLASFADGAAQAGIGLSFAPADEGEIELDPLRIREVLVNLLSNALRHTPRGGGIVVTLTRNSSELAVAVSDSGAGIAAADLPHIFERFYKGANSRGSGLGLAIARSLVQAHGGEISALSPPGAGATLRFVLPLSREA